MLLCINKQTYITCSHQNVLQKYTFVLEFCDLNVYSKKKDNCGSSKHENSPRRQKEKAKKKQDPKFPATDGVSLEYFLSELSDDDSTSW